MASSLLKYSNPAPALKGCGFSRATEPFVVVIPSRPQPRLRGEGGEESAFLSSPRV